MLAKVGVFRCTAVGEFDRCLILPGHIRPAVAAGGSFPGLDTTGKPNLPGRTPLLWPSCGRPPTNTC